MLERAGKLRLEDLSKMAAALSDAIEKLEAKRALIGPLNRRIVKATIREAFKAEAHYYSAELDKNARFQHITSMEAALLLLKTARTECRKALTQFNMF